MNYRLVKELKDANFPKAHVGWLDDGNHILAPDLEELIKACGEGFWELSKDGGTHEWLAYDPEQKFISGGSTPNEAVARLWLALNKK